MSSHKEITCIYDITPFEQSVFTTFEKSWIMMRVHAQKVSPGGASLIEAACTRTYSYIVYTLLVNKVIYK